MLLVQSEFAGITQTLASLQSVGLDAKVIAQQWIPFGPVLTRAGHVAGTNRLACARPPDEKLVVIRAEKA